ncbi:MAG: tryptophan-rich sensory protein [Candidatus Altiarchaeota archaeon]|nr:tryptophan-rich sensory protein [Candidatus Altiarchaeota archaeon]
MKNLKIIVASLLLCLTVGYIGSIYTAPSIPAWYESLEKPSFNPPNWIFAPVWTILYVLMGLSFYLVWRKDLKFKKTKKAAILFLIQLALNILWSAVFFGMKDIQLALAVIVVLWILIAETIYEFSKKSTSAALLLLPYLCWVAFATILNYNIMLLN